MGLENCNNKKDVYTVDLIQKKKNWKFLLPLEIKRENLKKSIKLIKDGF